MFGRETVIVNYKRGKYSHVKFANFVYIHELRTEKY